jgi:type IV fimbrial biogenesis protein FimT
MLLPLKKWAGFSLLELLFTLLILAILLTLAEANWTPFWTGQQINLETRSLYRTLQFARSEAIKENTPVGVCGTEDFQHCSPDWSKGYMVFQGKSILRIENRQTPYPIHSKRRKMFTFKGDGQCLTRGSIYVGDSPKKRLIIPDSGRVRIEDIS